MRLAQARIWGVLSVILTALVLGGCGRKPATEPELEPGKDNQQPLPQPGRPTPPKDPNQGGDDAPRYSKADLTLSSQEFKDQFLGNAKDFHAKHQHEVIDIVGTVTGFEYSGTADRGHLTLNPGGLQIGCWDPHPMAKAMPGQKIALRGKWIPSRGYEKLVIASAEGEGPPTIKAEGLANAWKANYLTAFQQYERKFLIVTGTLQSVRTEQKMTGPEYSLVFAETGTDFNFDFGRFAKDIAERNGWLKPGQSVRVMGQWLYRTPNLSGCVVLPPTK